MESVTVMNWNVQNYGPTKSGLLFGNYDVVNAIAKIVVEAHVDIFCMLEVNTTRENIAAQVCANLLNALERYAHSQGRVEWRTCVLSPNTGREFYAFFIRDTTFTRPMPIVGPAGNFGPLRVLGPGQGAGVTDAVFRGTTATGVLSHFPLMIPDVGRPRVVPRWPGSRFPVLALFDVPTARAANRLLTLFASCHFAANHTLATNQIRLLEYFSVLRSLSAGNGPPVQLRVDPYGTGPTQRSVNYSVTLGDFNIDYQRSRGSYAPLEQQLGAAVADSDVDTHLITANYTERIKDTWDLPVNLYDNFFTLINPAAYAPVGHDAAVVDNIPEDVRSRYLQLNASVAHYADLDQRGFVGNDPYLTPGKFYASQIAGRTAYITIWGALLGARLISDHLPVTMELTI